jgi:hypothetical protein
MNKLLHRTTNNRWCSLQIDSLDSLAQIVAAADEVAKVLPSHFSLRLDLGRFLLLELELLNVSLQTDADVVGGALECAADLGADTKSVRVGVVDRR